MPIGGGRIRRDTLADAAKAALAHLDDDVTATAAMDRFRIGWTRFRTALAALRQERGIPGKSPRSRT